MKRGDAARKDVTDTIIKAFQDKDAFVCTQDKKIYVTARDGANNEVIQFAVSITMPKVPVQGGPQTVASTDWREDSKNSEQKASPNPIFLSPEDYTKVQDLMKRLGVEDKDEDE